MKILITGAKGFIGSHLGNTLKERGFDVLGIDNESHASKNKTSFPVIKGEAKDASLDGVDAVIHLAAHINVDESLERPEMYLENNLIQTVTLLEKVRKHPKCRFILASSAEVYGTAQYDLMDEEHPVAPMSPYALSKRAAEEACEFYRRLYGLDIKVIRKFNTWGMHQHDGQYGGVIAKFKKYGREGRALPVYGTGEQERDYSHVSQQVEGYILALTTKDFPDLVNLGSGSSVKIIDIAKKVGEKFNVEIEHLPARKGELHKLRAHIPKAQAHGYMVQDDFWTRLEEFLGDEQN